MGKLAAALSPQQKPVLKATLESASEAVIDSASREKAVGEPPNQNVLQELLVWLMANGTSLHRFSQRAHAICFNLQKTASMIAFKLQCTTLAVVAA